MNNKKIMTLIALVGSGIILAGSMQRCCSKKSASNMRTIRQPQYAVSDIFLNRYSPRAMSGESITDEELMSLFEAARWAPSSYNNQSWRFIYAKRGTASWNRLFNLLVPFNQQWAKNAAVLVVVVSRNTFEHNNQPSGTHSFDTGAAWQNVALQASMNGLITHGMAGFDYEKARTELNIPEGYTVEAMIAIGKPGNIEDLPEAMQKGETPSGRKPVEEFAFEGSFRE